MTDTRQIEQGGFDPRIPEGASIGALAARSSAAVAVAKTLRYGFVFVVHVLLMNLLTPQDFGLVRYVTVILGMLNLVNEAGLSFAIVQKRELVRSELGAAFTVNLVLSCLLYLLVYAAAPGVASLLRAEPLTALMRAGALAVPLGGVSVVHRAALQRQFKYAQLSIIEVVSAVVGSSVSLVMAWLGFGVWSLVWGTVVFCALSTLLLFATGTWFEGYFRELRQVVPLFAFGGGVVALRIVDYCGANADYLVVGWSFGARTLGIYGVAYDVVTLPQLALGVVLASVALSAFSRFQDDTERLTESFLRLTLVVSVVATPFLVFVGAMAEDLMYAVSFLRPGDKWLPAAQPIQILTFVGLLYSFTSYPGIVWIAKGRIRLRVGWGVVSLVTVVAAVLIGRFFGIMGVCWALLVRAVVLFPAMLLITRDVIGLPPLRYAKALVPAVTCGVLMYTLLAIVPASIQGTSLGVHMSRIALAAVGGIGVYVCALYFIFRNSWGTIAAIVPKAFGREGGGGAG